MIRRFLFMFVAFTAISLFGADGVKFSYRQLCAGRDSLENSGFVVTRTLGVAAFSPELCFPVEIVYDSSRVESGIFGYGWYSPQIESSLNWDGDGLVWISPWGEVMKFFPKKNRSGADKRVAKVPHMEEARKGRGLFLPYGDWEADSLTYDYQKAKKFSITGKNSLKGWKFNYSCGCLESIETPCGIVVVIEYNNDRRPSAIVSGLVRFIEIFYRDKRS